MPFVRLLWSYEAEVFSTRCACYEQSASFKRVAHESHDAYLLFAVPRIYVHVLIFVRKETSAFLHLVT